jgi:chromosome partitioning protein
MLMSNIITIFNQKGGCGKSTITMQIAGRLGLLKHKVLIIDLDPQGTASIWHAQALNVDGNKQKPFPADIVGIDPNDNLLIDKLRKYIDVYDYIIIDCPPSAETIGCSAAIMVSDLVLIPTIPSPADIWASVTAVALVNKSKATNKNLIVYIVPTMVRANSALASAMVEHIADTIDIQLTRTSIGLRTSYQDSALNGSTVHGLPNSRKAASEVNSLVSEILRIIKRGK